MYYPKNKIQTNLYTGGKELQYVISKKEYVGFYWADYTGRFFTGKNPNDAPVEELIDIVPQTLEPKIPGEDKSYNFESYRYGEIREEQSYLSHPKVPNTYYPNPNEEDYKLGEFNRYFCKKENEVRYIEISNETYKSLKSQNPEFLWTLWFPFLIEWQIMGERKKVFKTNSNIVKLQEQQLNSRGFGMFLRYDYLKFYRYTPQEDLYTKGGELATIKGEEYMGHYHINEKLGPMVGKTHLSTPHNRLLYIDSLSKPIKLLKRPFQPGKSSY